MDGCELALGFTSTAQLSSGVLYIPLSRTIRALSKGTWGILILDLDLRHFFLPPAWLGRAYDAGSSHGSQNLYTFFEGLGVGFGVYGFWSLSGRRFAVAGRTLG